MLCATCCREIMQGAAFCPYCGKKVVTDGPAEDTPVYQADVKRVLRSGKLVVYRDRTEFVVSSVQRSVFSYADLVAVKKEWDHIDFITEDGHKESCPADRKCIHEAFLHIEQAVRPYLVRRKERLLSQGVRYSFLSSQGVLNDGVLNISVEQAEFVSRSGKNEVVSFRDIKSVSAFAGTLDLVLFDRHTKSFAISKELRDEVLDYVSDCVSVYLAQRKEALLAKGIYFSFFGPDGGTVDILADRLERRVQTELTDSVLFQNVRSVGMYDGMLELAMTDGTSKSFSIDLNDANEVLAFIRNAIEPYVRGRTDGFDVVFGIDERIEINEARGVFHIIRQSGMEITDEWPLDSLTECRWEERKNLNALGSVVSGGIALFKTAARAAGSQTVSDAEERFSCAGAVVTFGSAEDVRTESIWFGLFPSGMSRTNKKYDRYLDEWAKLSDYLNIHCPECEQVEPEIPEPAPGPEMGDQSPENETDTPDTAPDLSSDGGAPYTSDTSGAMSRQDALGIAKYIDGISRFIGSCATPMTVAFQGNRGSGENNALRILFNRLGEQGGNHRLLFNVRQFSKIESGEALSGLVGKKLLGLFSDGVNAAEKGGTLIANLAGLVTGMVADDSSIGKDMVVGLLSKPSEDPFEYLPELFSQKVEKLSRTGKVVLFVDSMDQLSPARAVELLEAMRPFLACKGCVFVIATDYSVILSGMRELYGQDHEESRGRAFFNEIFKMSFRVPASGYNIDNYVKSKLEQLGIQCEDEDEIELYASLIYSSVGKKLESIDRLFTSFRLLKSMADEEIFESRCDRLVLFALLCMQTGFRDIYDFIVQRRSSVTPEFLAGLCGYSSQPWGAEHVGDGERAAFQDFGHVFARIIDLYGSTEISEAECRAFVTALELSVITSQ